jgi:uncharacterized protein
VRWYPWGEAAFDKARRENKPIFLSIGYASCHWCHVMEKESFENEALARALNDSFVSIKVDREDRPDVDRIYMNAALVMTGAGGWPLTLFLTPDKKPFFAATYIPLEDRGDQKGFRTLVAAIAEAWKDRREALVGSAERLHHAIRLSELPAAALEKQVSRAEEEAASRPESRGVAAELAYIREILARKQQPVPLDLLAAAGEQLLSIEDKTYGGFGDETKFPVPLDALALLHAHARHGTAGSLEAVERQYVAMARGGIRDWLAGGFHRYSTDRAWEVPHFEKMLYDQALIARVYLELAQATGKPEYEALCHATLDFCLSGMRAPEGGFIAALDATVRGEEGATYLWTKEEIERVLPEGDARTAFERWAGFDQAKPGEKLTIAERRREEAASRDDRARMKDLFDRTLVLNSLREARKERPQPARVEHVITSWNAWLVSALARAGMVLNERRYRDAALETMKFLDAKLRRPDGLYARRYVDGEARFAGELSDQAAVLEALLDLHEMTLDASWLNRALDLVPKIADRFGRPDGSFDDSVEPDLVFRTRETSDGAVPSGSSQMNVALARLARMTGRPEDLGRARRAIQALLPDVGSRAADHAYGAIAWDLAFSPGARVVFFGPRPIVSMTVPALVEAGAEDARASAVVWIDDKPSPPAFDSAAILAELEKLGKRAESR